MDLMELTEQLNTRKNLMNNKYFPYNIVVKVCL